MANALTTDQPTDQPIRFLSMALLRLSGTDEKRMSDDQFGKVRDFALSPFTPSPPADAGAVRKTITALAGVLKMRRMDGQQAALNFELYVRAISGFLAVDALDHAFARAIRELEWMPTPRELIALAEPFESDEVRARRIAKEILAHRENRVMRETFARLRAHEIPIGDVEGLGETIVQLAERDLIVARDMDGRLFYRTVETVARDAAARRAFTASLLHPAPGGDA